MKIVFYGSGNMASAIFRGMLDNKIVSPKEIYLTSKDNKERVEALHDELNVNYSYDDEELCRDTDYLVLASKPQNFPDVADRIRPYLEPKTKIVSIMAGTQIKTISRELKLDNPVARIMPNTNAQVQHSVNGITYSSNFTAKDELIEIMESFGKAVEIEEIEMHAITAATGSGSAFLYYIYEKYAECVMELGFTEEQAMFLTRNLVIGTGKMISDSDESFSELRRKITSKQGTTEAGLLALDETNIKENLMATLQAAHDRSEELAKE